MISILTDVVTAGIEKAFPCESVPETVPESVYTCDPARRMSWIVPIVIPAVADVV